MLNSIMLSSFLFFERPTSTRAAHFVVLEFVTATANGAEVR